ncbi:PTS mannose/fructose/sorbose/N-acetylgalactosamine transporter subunit IIC [Dellaglioa algida]|uniref:PTS mannose/fructose/sorbose/N-acetylgalactosamine transporter subunit IIC n=1 Tax=Dellaglioa algida TaxID=105612 RepID=UPI0024C4BCEF|nr:PTS sugar transporter subunit IIC [Dellaglioa algida]MDK1727924.1 PTS sugar transporter subunit IIC [Dellaglioa algida]MDK1735679.1 PTS sugar transporter subunit IIC [Dellaglioa algida]MDK1737255.1 PTS sugar transporter subunit IIC [Dellaglioa algida]
MIIIQDILVILLAGLMMVDENGPVIISWFPVILGTIMGVIMGDMSTALAIAGTFQLMMLGVAAIGGSSTPNYGLATIIGAFVAIRTGTGVNAAVAIGIPIGLLGMQLEVIGRLICNFLVHRMMTLNEKHLWKSMNRVALLGPVLFFCQTAIPTALVVIIGPTFVKALLKAIPTWITDGLAVAGGMLPVVGIALLLRYMPVSKFLTFILIGFVMAAYMNVPLFGIAIIGFSGAYFYFFSTINKSKNVVQTEEGNDYDE